MQYAARMSRNLLAGILTAGGILLLGLAALDWTRYSTFVISLIWA